MTTDLPTRNREAAELLISRGYGDIMPNVIDDLRESADEVEQLRADLDLQTRIAAKANLRIQTVAGIVESWHWEAAEASGGE